MKEQLLKIFNEHEGQYVSGEKISEALGCSRTAIWKHIDALRKSGYELQSAPRKGYRLIKKGDSIQPHDIKSSLTTKRLGQEQTYFESTESTQIIAHKLAQEGVNEGHLVVANEQTSGKGRLARKWYSRAGASISMSVILRPKLSPQETPQLTLLTAVAVVRAIKKQTGLSADIKWPNDVLLNGKKVVGILTEMQADPDFVHSVIIGIGINVNHHATDLDSEILGIATSLAIEKGSDVDRAALISVILLELETLYELYLTDGFSTIRTLWETHSNSIGTYLTAKTAKSSIYGFAKGISDEGCLLLEDQLGEVHQIYSADIELMSNS
ncbi:biotin--[acetyl-CoA-carboxylase] ligase [Bacillus suaedae]|uniref:Bifunctional ligase/repressor BirA n=1 Tax=Halalkalibacter suaedae TaxID=2822140 RepID=A0A940WYW4_9BACI|nr:biotin--[acetyl-CoA-carboxylase] ligase [Bacillus suaedae]MBP3950619.1 biotin--[acetyl-CoA-carboxylase] ligase [Bacillus suaedae]